MATSGARRRAAALLLDHCVMLLMCDAAAHTLCHLCTVSDDQQPHVRCIISMLIWSCAVAERAQPAAKCALVLSNQLLDEALHQAVEC